MRDMELTFYDESIKLIEVIEDINLSDTQSLKTLVIERNGERLISFQKWWRVSANQSWREGKGFYFNKSETTSAIDSLSKAVNKMD